MAFFTCSKMALNIRNARSDETTLFPFSVWMYLLQAQERAPSFWISVKVRDIVKRLIKNQGAINTK